MSAGSGTAMVVRPPAEPKSSVRPEISTGTRLPGWDYFIPNEHEKSPAWQWPTVIDTVDMMRDDPQVAGIENTLTLPPQDPVEFRRELDPNTMDLVAAEKLADDLDVPRVGQDQPPGRSPLRFSMGEHVARAFKAPANQVEIFEIAGRIDDDGWWRLVDLQPIPLRTITRFDVSRAGRITAVWQWQAGVMRDVRIDAEHLVVYVWGGESGNPLGRSMFRPLWRPVGSKDRHSRLDLIQKDKGSMGIPWLELPPDASQADRDAAVELLASLASGEETNVVIPSGSRFGIAGTTGTLPDPIKSMEYHDKQMLRACSAQVLAAGDTGNGTYSSATTHDEMLDKVRTVIASRTMRQLTVQVAARWAMWNGLDPAATLIIRRPQQDQPSGATRGTQAPVEASGRRARQAPAGRARRPVAAAADVSLPDRPLRRDPTALEAASGVDFAQVDTDWQTTTDVVTEHLAGIRDDLAARALDAIRDMDDVDPLTLADLLAPILREAADEQDTDALQEALEQAARDGVEQVTAEVDRQGRTISPPALDYTDRAQLEATNAARRLAASLVETASNAALTSTTPGATGAAVADAVEQAVDRLTDAQPQRAAGAASSRAQNAGRAHAIATADYAEIYGSALLDRNTCGPCIDWDGRTFETLDEALDQYPGGGGNKDCEGGDQCRCLVICVLATEQERAT